MVNHIIETFDLSKTFKLKGQNKTIDALNNVNIQVKEDEIFGLLGPNGAGKTTLIQILSTLEQPTSGSAIIDGYDVVKKPNHAKSRISLMMDHQMLYFRITAYDNLKFFCKIYDVPNYKEKIFDLAKNFGLEKWLNQYVENFSGGMKIKLALVRSLILNRKILILDEPTLGLDVKMRSFIINKLKEFKGAIFLTSHNMRVVEKLCDRVAFINKGKIIKIGTQEEVKKLSQTEIIVDVEIQQKSDQLKFELKNKEFVGEIFDLSHGIAVSIKSRDNYKDLLSVLSKYHILKVKERDLSLEDLFLKLI